MNADLVWMYVLSEYPELHWKRTGTTIRGSVTPEGFDIELRPDSRQCVHVRAGAMNIPGESPRHWTEACLKWACGQGISHVTSPLMQLPYHQMSPPVFTTATGSEDGRGRLTEYYPHTRWSSCPETGIVCTVVPPIFGMQRNVVIRFYTLSGTLTADATAGPRDVRLRMTPRPRETGAEFIHRVVRDVCVFYWNSETPPRLRGRYSGGNAPSCTVNDLVALLRD